MTATRSDHIDAFLADSGWGGAERAALAGDASFRRYERITLGPRRAVLMDAPPEREDIAPFLNIGRYLLEQGFSAPCRLAHDTQQGFLLLEDLGDDLFSRYLRRAPQEEEILYLAATEQLCSLHQCSRTARRAIAQPYDTALLLKEIGLFAEWFLPAVMERKATAEKAASFTELWSTLLAQMPILEPVLVLRDYHADNLLWLPEREGIKRIGLLDFQDAVLGSPAYDLVSFLEDARRDVTESTVSRVLARYLDMTGLPEEAFMAAYALLGAQRNCKIIGIFARLFLRDGKRPYLDYLPRVWGHLERDLAHPLLRPLKLWMDTHVKPEWRSPQALAQAAKKGAA